MEKSMRDEAPRDARVNDTTEPAQDAARLPWIAPAVERIALREAMGGLGAGVNEVASS
jgi:hypothetical protein